MAAGHDLSRSDALVHPTRALPQQRSVRGSITSLRGDASFSFTFEQCSVVTTRGKVIMNAVDGFAISGGVLAIMGPSGAGKTTLLRMLTLSHMSGITPSGRIHLHRALHGGGIQNLLRICGAVG